MAGEQGMTSRRQGEATEFRWPLESDYSLEDSQGEKKPLYS